MLFLLFVFGAVVPYALGDSACEAQPGTCQEDHLACSGSYVSGLCSGGVTRRCCVPGDSGCTSQSGTCQEDSQTCPGGYVSNMCSGGATRRCCLPSSGDDSGCTSQSGNCQEDHLACSGSYVSNLCSGGATRRCCVPSSGSSGCSNVNIISRAQWGARVPTSTTAITVPVSKFFIHHTATASCSTVTDCSSRVRSIQNYHMDNRGWDDIGYSFLVGEDGNVYEGRGWTKVGAHTSNFNDIAFAASMIGSYGSHIPNTQAITAVKNLIACGVELGKITSTYNLYGHRDAGTTTCPGNALYNEIQTWPHYSTTPP